MPTTYAITVTQTLNGTISPSTTAVVSGANQTFTITPDSGYVVYDVKVDGTSVGAVSTYTFTAVTATHTITATYVMPINAYIETGDMDSGIRGFEKLMEEVYPDLLAQSETNSLYIQCGVRDNLSKPIVWGPSIPFRIGTDFYADMRNYASQGAYLRLRFYSNIIDSPWSLGGFTAYMRRGRKLR
jgi:hypothetical protein